VARPQAPSSGAGAPLESVGGVTTTQPLAIPGEDPLGRKLVWTTLFRLGVVTVLLGVTGFQHWASGSEDPAIAPRPLYAVIAGTYLASLAYAFVLRARKGLRQLAFMQVAFDVALAAAVVSFTGRSDSPFIFLFSLATVTGSILLYRRGAIAATILALGAYVPVMLWPGAPAVAPVMLFVQGSAFAITAALSAYLAEQLRRTGEQLAAREVDLEAITALHEAIVQSVSSGILTISAEGRITFMNPAAQQITGLQLAQVRGRTAARWFSDFQPSESRGETQYVNARGERLTMGYTIFPLVRGEDEIGTAVIFQDLTELRAMEENVQRSTRLAALGRVAAGLAHELRNPLASMTGSIELLRGTLSLDAENARLMDIVLREAERLNDLVSRFLEYSRPSPPRREQVDLARVVEETLQVFAHDPVAARMQIERSLAPATAWCDPDQIRQVLWNLLVNAAQAAGGAVRLQIFCGPEAGGRARLEVVDDGPGIAEADLTQIFVPFFTTKEGGTGLGLAIVQRIVDAHGGTVKVHSVVGRGTTFIVSLPGARAPEAGSR
jgi:two-component system sensor histidine kinase PilS (NtrC family)